MSATNPQFDHPSLFPVFKSERGIFMEDETIIGLDNDRDESAIPETDKKYGGYCRTVSYNILQNRPDTVPSSAEVR